MPEIPSDLHDLFEKASIAHFVTMMPDGTPHATPVWIDIESDRNRLLVNTERGRRKEKYVRENPKVAVSMIDPDNPYRYLSVSGEVNEITTKGAREHINKLTQRYTSKDEYPIPIKTERVILKICPEEVRTELPSG